MVRNIVGLTGLVLLGLSLSGCMSVAPFEYSGAQMPMASFAGPVVKHVAVLPVLDGRPMGLSDSGSFFWGLLPLMPHGAVKKPYPERSDNFVSLGRFFFNPTEELATASALSLQASKLFEQTTLARSAAKAGDAEYLWQGTLTDTSYSGALITYGITYFAAPVLWVVGAPEGVSRNTFGIRFDLVERATGETVWSYDFRGTERIVHWIYARVGKDTQNYAELMRRAMNDALSELNRSFPKE